MSERIEINLLSKAILVEAPDELGVQHLHAAARALDAKMQQIRAHNPSMPTERVAIMAALNSTHELLRLQIEKTQIEQETQASLQRMQAWVDL